MQPSPPQQQQQQEEEEEPESEESDLGMEFVDTCIWQDNNDARVGQEPPGTFYDWNILRYHLAIWSGVKCNWKWRIIIVNNH